MAHASGLCCFQNPAESGFVGSMRIRALSGAQAAWAASSRASVDWWPAGPATMTCPGPQTHMCEPANRGTRKSGVTGAGRKAAAGGFGESRQRLVHPCQPEGCAQRYASVLNTVRHSGKLLSFAQLHAAAAAAAHQPTGSPSHLSQRRLGLQPRCHTHLRHRHGHLLQPAAEAVQHRISTGRVRHMAIAAAAAAAACT